MRLVRDAAFGWYSGFPLLLFAATTRPAHPKSRAAPSLYRILNLLTLRKFQYFDASGPAV